MMSFEPSHSRDSEGLEGDILPPIPDIVFPREDYAITLATINFKVVPSSGLNKNALNFIKTALAVVGVDGTGEQKQFELIALADAIFNALMWESMRDFDQLSGSLHSLNGVHFEDRFRFNVGARVIDDEVNWVTEVSREIEIKLEGRALVSRDYSAGLIFSYAASSGVLSLTFCPSKKPNQDRRAYDWEQFDAICKGAGVDPLYSTDGRWSSAVSDGERVELVTPPLGICVERINRYAIVPYPQRSADVAHTDIPKEETLSFGGHVILHDLSPNVRRKVLGMLKSEELDDFVAAFGDLRKLQGKPDPLTVTTLFARLNGGAMSVGYECFFDDQSPIVEPFLSIECPNSEVGRVAIHLKGREPERTEIYHSVPVVNLHPENDELSPLEAFRLAQYQEGILVDWHAIRRLTEKFYPDEPDTWR